MTAPRLLIIDPSTCTPEDDGVEQVRKNWPGDVTRLRPSLGPEYGPSAATGHDFTAAVLMGSAASVHEDSSWHRHLMAWLEPLLNGSIALPLLAICYGHQLIAKMHGGEVGPAHPDGTKLFGVEDSELHDCRLLPGRQSLRCIVSHYEAVTRVPEGYRVVASRPQLPFDALEHAEFPIFTFQGHPEARESFLETRGLPGDLVDDELRSGCDALLRAFQRFALDAPSR